MRGSIKKSIAEFRKCVKNNKFLIDALLLTCTQEPIEYCGSQKTNQKQSCYYLGYWTPRIVPFPFLNSRLFLWNKVF